jgi:hypothetical protein
MFGRRYGTTHVKRIGQNLEPMESEPWLRESSPALTLKRVLLSLGLVVLVLASLYPLANAELIPDSLIGMLFLLCGAALLVGLFFFAPLYVQQWYCRMTRQYCPDCLSYMTLGAHVCPFCGFRAEPTRSGAH